MNFLIREADPEQGKWTSGTIKCYFTPMNVISNKCGRTHFYFFKKFIPRQPRARSDLTKQAIRRHLCQPNPEVSEMCNCTVYICLLLIISLTETCSYTHMRNTSCIICALIQSYLVLDQRKQGMKRYTID